METENLNITPENGGSDNKSEKAAKAKKVAGKAAQFAGAAGLGVAGTMAANAMNTQETEPEATGETVTSPATPVNEEKPEEAAATPEEFDPNDIMIEDVEEAVIEEGDAELSTNTSQEEDLVVEIQPITEDDIDHENLAIIDIDDNPEEIIVDPVDECMYGGPEGWDGMNEPESLLADTDEIGSEPDILDDILA